MQELKIKSSLDNTIQPSLFFKASEKNKPLLVGLHSWSFNRFNQVENFLPYVQKHDFNLLLPEFRGANLASNPNCVKACGSKYAVQDIFDAIEYVKANYEIDEKNIFLLGASGGGHMSLMCGANNPMYFKAIGAFVPITDLLRWTKENKGYAPHVQVCCGSEEEMRKRSPITYIKELSQTNLKIFHGKFDKVVPYLQSYDLYTNIQELKTNARVFLDVFDGGHEMNMDVAFDWFLSQYKKERLTAVTG